MSSLIHYTYIDLYNIIKKHSIKTKIIDLSKISNSLSSYISEDSIQTEEIKKVFYKNEDLYNQIREVIEEYEEVIFKFNRKFPIDSIFLMTEGKCLSIEDMFILLKASSLIISHIQVEEKINLQIKKWYKLNKEDIYRFYIKDNRLIGIAQRHTSILNHKSYDDLVIIKSLAFNLCKEVIQLVTSNESTKLQSQFDFVIDVIVYLKSGRIKIIDIEDLFYLDDDETSLFSKEEIYLIGNESKESKEWSVENVIIRVVNSVEGISNNEKLIYDNMFPCEMEVGDNVKQMIKKIDEMEQLNNN